MTTTLQAHGGGAQPASIDTSGKVAGGVALRVYGFDSVEAAQAAGYVCEGGPAMSVALITDAQIAAGDWKAEGDPAALIVYTAPSNMPVEGGYALPVYSVNGWGSSTPAPVAPLFDSAEIGTVNASTVAVTFDQDVSAAGNDYSSGVTIKVNGATRPFESGIRQSNHAIVYYALSLAVVYSDVVTWEYAEASGSIVAEDDSTPLGDVSAQSVTNNVADTIGDGLRADAVAYWTFNDTQWLDSVHDSDLTPNNGPTVAAGKIGNAVSLDSTQTLTTASNANLKMTGTFTLAGWFKADAAANTTVNHAIVGKIGNSFGDYFLELGFPSDGKWDVTFQIADGNDTGAISPVTRVGVDQWYFVVAGYDSSSNTLWLIVNNTVNENSSTVTNKTILPTDDPFYFADGTSWGDPNFHGLLDEWGVWKRLLTSDERDYLYNSGAGRTLYP